MKQTLKSLVCALAFCSTGLTTLACSAAEIKVEGANAWNLMDLLWGPQSKQPGFASAGHLVVTCVVSERAGPPCINWQSQFQTPTRANVLSEDNIQTLAFVLDEVGVTTKMAAGGTTWIIREADLSCSHDGLNAKCTVND